MARTIVLGPVARAAVAVVGLGFTLAAAARGDTQSASFAPTFANATLTNNTKQLAEDQAKALFPTGPGAPTDCTRGEPQRWLEAGRVGVRSSYFVAVSNQRSVEAALLDDGSNVVIAQWGCEYYAASLRITWAARPAATSDTRHWYAVAGKWLRRLAASKPATPVHLEEAGRALLQQARTARPATPGEPLTVAGGGIPETVGLVAGRTLSDGKGSVLEITILIGPL